jgi:hypothetical protein
VIDAMELALRDRVQGFVIVSSDSDFSRLAIWLREHGFVVSGVGDGKAPARLTRCYSHFFEARPPKEPAPVIAAPPKASTPPAPKLAPDGDQKVYAAMATTLHRKIAETGGSVLLSGINKLLQGQKGMRPMKSTRYGDWKTFVAAYPEMFQVSGTGTETNVAVKSIKACRAS